jgi:quercetin dioxygenase-like cupin family protein
MTTQQPWPWPERMDALHAAPASHRVLLDNDRVRVLDVAIEPGAREPEHTHIDERRYHAIRVELK